MAAHPLGTVLGGAGRNAGGKRAGLFAAGLHRCLRMALALAVWQRAALVDASLSTHRPLPHAFILASTAGLVSLLAAFALWGLFF